MTTQQDINELRAITTKLVLNPDAGHLMRMMFDHIPALLAAWDERERLILDQACHRDELKAADRSRYHELKEAYKQIAAANAEIERLKHDRLGKCITDLHRMHGTALFERDAAIARAERFAMLLGETRQYMLVEECKDDPLLRAVDEALKEQQESKP